MLRFSLGIFLFQPYVHCCCSIYTTELYLYNLYNDTTIQLLVVTSSSSYNDTTSSCIYTTRRCRRFRRSRRFSIPKSKTRRQHCRMPKKKRKPDIHKRIWSLSFNQLPRNLVILQYVLAAFTNPQISQFRVLISRFVFLV